MALKELGAMPFIPEIESLILDAEANLKDAALILE